MYIFEILENRTTASYRKLINSQPERSPTTLKSHTPSENSDRNPCKYLDRYL